MGGQRGGSDPEPHGHVAHALWLFQQEGNTRETQVTAWLALELLDRIDAPFTMSLKIGLTPREAMERLVANQPIPSWEGAATR